MTIDSALGSITSLTNTVQGSLSTIARAGADLGLGGVGPGAAGATKKYWKDTLQPASFKGVPFGVVGGGSHFGRRTAIHEYPFRDTVWVEDLGRAARRFTVQGFLVGDDCIAQRERLIAACEVRGLASLVHPTYGLLTVSLIGLLSVEERWDRGRMFEFSFSVIESGERKFPGTSTSTAAGVQAAAAGADAAAKVDFATKAAAALKNGAAVVSQAVATTQKWTKVAQRLANDATNLRNMVGTLSGNFGRFAGGRSGAGLGGAIGKLAGGTATVATLIAAGAKARTGVSTAIAFLTSKASDI